MTGKLSTRDVQLHPDKKGGVFFSKTHSKLLIQANYVCFFGLFLTKTLVKQARSRPDLSAVKRGATANGRKKKSGCCCRPAATGPCRGFSPAEMACRADGI